MEAVNSMEIIVISSITGLFVLLFALSWKAFIRSWQNYPVKAEKLAIQEMSGAFIKLAIAQFRQRSKPISEQQPEQMIILLKQQDELVASYNKLLDEYQQEQCRTVSILRVK